MTGEELLIRPTVILRVGEDTLSVVTAGEGAGEALIVFRGPGDAEAFRERTGKAYSAAEGYQLVGMGHEAISSLADLIGVRLVAMPEPLYAGGAGAGVDTFDAGDFVAMLAEAGRG